MVPPEGLAKHTHLTRIGNGDPDHHANGAGLPGTIRAKQAKDTALLDCQGEVFDRNKLVVTLANL